MNMLSLPISEFCKTGSGTTPSRQKHDRYYGGNIPWVKSGELRESIVRDTEEKITEDALTETSLKIAPKGAVLVAMYGANVGRVGILGIEATTNQAICYVVPDKEKADSRYIFHALQQKLPEFISRSVGGAQPNISQQIIKETKIPLPPLAEQKRIAAILDKAEELRSQRRQALEQLDVIAQSIFLEMFGDPAINSKKWEISKIGNISIQITDGEHQTPKRTLEGIKLLSARNVKDGYIDVRDVDFIGVEEYERIKKRCNPVWGDILISCSGTIGRVATVETNEPFSLVRSAALIKLRKDLINSKFAEYFLRTPFLKNTMQQRANSSSQANLFQNQIRELPAFIPPITLQQEFAQRVEAIAQLKASHRESLAQLDALFASLQHRAFRGEL